MAFMLCFIGIIKWSSKPYTRTIGHTFTFSCSTWITNQAYKNISLRFTLIHKNMDI